MSLSPQVWKQLHSIGRQKEAPPLETLEMTLRQHFCLPGSQEGSEREGMVGERVTRGFLNQFSNL